MTCAQCDGDGCDDCKRTGIVWLKECPQRAARGCEVLMHAWRMMRTHGMMPRLGGWLDQTWYFQRAVEFIDAELVTHGR